MRYCLLVSLISFSLPAQTGSVGLPILGFAPDAQSRQIRPIRGIPGAAVLGDLLESAPAFRALAISPKQDLAIAVSAENDGLLIVRFTGQTALPVPDAVQAPSHIVFSPSGRAAAIWSSRIQVLTDLAATPRVTDIASDSFAAPSVLALSDDARVLIASSAQDDTPVWLADATGSTAQLPLPGSVSVLAFRAETHNAVAVTRSGDVYVVTDAGSNADIRQIYAGDNQTSDPVAAQISPDGTRVFTANSRGTVAAINIQTGIASFVSCRCSPTGLEPLSAPALYRLTDISGVPVMLFDASTPTPQVWFVPVDDSRAGQQRSAQ
jgi:hypothetical protein